MDENRIREALEARASEAELPEDLADRTIDEARELARPTLRERFGAWRDARWGQGRVRGYPWWAYAGATAGVLVLFFAVGTVALDTGDDFGGSEALSERTEDFEASPTRGGSGPIPGEPDAVQEHVAGLGVPGSELPQQDTADSPVVEPPIIEPPGPEAPAEFPPRLIREADISIEVEDFDRAWRDAHDLATEHGGFVTDSDTSQQDGELSSGSLTIRVPAANLQDALRDLQDLGELEHLSTSAADVSGQLVDLDARIRSSQAQEAQLLELLQQATEVSDILEVRTRLDMVRSEIERMTAQKELLQNQVDLATIRVSLFEPDAAPEEDEPDGNRFAQAWDQAVDVALTISSGFIVVLGVLAPFVALALIVWLVVALARRRRT